MKSVLGNNQDDKTDHINNGRPGVSIQSKNNSLGVFLKNRESCVRVRFFYLFYLFNAVVGDGKTRSNGYVNCTSSMSLATTPYPSRIWRISLWTFKDFSEST